MKVFLTDAELIALAALVQVEAVQMEFDRHMGCASSSALPPHAAELEAELARRKKAREELSLVRFELLQEQVKAMAGLPYGKGIMDGRVPNQVPVPLPRGDMPATEVPTPRD